MATASKTPGPDRKRQKGALMVGVVAMLAISLIWSAIAFQAWIDVLRRDNEAEMIFRAEEIVRAIQRYRRDHGGQGPQKLKDLLDPSPRRSYYIRKEYTDPLVPDGKWGLLYMGPGGSIIDPSEQLGLPGATPGVTQATGGSGTSLDQALGKGQSSPAGQAPGHNRNRLDSQTQAPGTLGGIGNRNSDGEGTGLPIAGVKTTCEERPFRVYRGETEYKKWLFTYLDIQAGGGAGKGKGKGKGNLGERLKGKGKGNT